MKHLASWSSAGRERKGASLNDWSWIPWFLSRLFQREGASLPIFHEFLLFHSKLPWIGYILSNISHVFLTLQKKCSFNFNLSYSYILSVGHSIFFSFIFLRFTIFIAFVFFKFHFLFFSNKYPYEFWENVALFYGSLSQSVLCFARMFWLNYHDPLVWWVMRCSTFHR